MVANIIYSDTLCAIIILARSVISAGFAIGIICSDNLCAIIIPARVLARFTTGPVVANIIYSDTLFNLITLARSSTTDILAIFTSPVVANIIYSDTLCTIIIPARSFQVACVMGLESYKSYHASRSQSFDSIFRTLRPSLQSSSRRTSDPPNFLVRPFVSTSSSSKRAHQDPRHKIKRVLTFDLLWYRAPSLQTPTIRPARPTHTRATTYFLRFSWCQQVKRNMKMSSPTSDRLPHDVHLNSLRVYAVL